MSDRSNPLGVSGMIMPPSLKPPSGILGPPRMGLNESERNLQPIYQQEMAEEMDERRWMKPLQWVFDRLQTGQYISANVANILAQTAKGVPEEERQTFMEAVVSGATGERKGSYEDVLRDTLGVGQRKLFENAPEGKRRGQVDWADVLGFVGDVLLDPLTYMTFGGATKGAQVAASSFADDSVRLFLRQMSSDPKMLSKVNSELAQAGGEGISRKAIERALAAGGSKGRSMVEKIGGDLGRVMDRTYKSAYREGLAKTQRELLEMTQGKIMDLGLADDIATGAQRGGLDSIMERVASETAYQKGGETFGLRIAGREKLKGQNNVIPNLTRNTWNRFANFFDKGKPGEKFSDAVWGMMNRGPVGEIRRALGFRNPYQKYLRSQELTQGKVLAEVSSNTALKESFEPLRGLDEAQVRDVLGYMAKQEEITAKAIASGQTDDVIGRTLRETADPQTVEAAGKLKATFDRWNSEEALWASRLGESVADYREWYVPEKFRYRQSQTNVKKVRKRTYLESYDAEKQLTKALYGVDDATATRMMEADLTGLGTNYQEAIAERALIHGRAKSRASLFEQFKEMGIDLRDATDPAAAALKTRGRDIKNLGMRTIDHPALEGFVFDYDVAEIFDRALKITGRDRNIFMRGMKSYANWWKGVVTSTTGFHARNFMSNTMTQFLRHGTRAFDKNEIMQSTAAVTYALRQADPKALLSEIGADEGWVNKLLGMRVGNLSIRELADEARRLGVISENTMGFSGQNILEKVAGKEGFSMTTGPIRRASRQIGNYTENISRFQSFLIDYADNFTADISKITPENLLKVEGPTLEWAAEQAKKWFLDYGDLSEFEQGFLKNVIPFYSWIRKNVVNQISGVTIYPEMYSLLPKIENLMEYEDPEYDPALVPDWMREAGAFPIGRTETGEFRFFKPDFAHKDLNLIPLEWEEGSIFPRFNFQETKDTIINATAPWLRDIASRMTRENGYSFLYKEDLAETADAPYLMRLIASRPGMITLLDGLLRRVGIENGAHMDVEDGKLQIDGKFAQTLQEYLPVLRQLEFLFYLPQAAPVIGPILEETIKNVTYAEGAYEGTELTMQMLSYYLGVKTIDKDIELEKQRLGRDIYFRARDALTEQRRQLPGAEARRMDYWRGVDDTVRRIE